MFTKPQPKRKLTEEERRITEFVIIIVVAGIASYILSRVLSQYWGEIFGSWGEIFSNTVFVLMTFGILAFYYRYVWRRPVR